MADQFTLPWQLKDIPSVFRGRENLLVKGLHGLEKESLRVDHKGNLAMTPHPKALGDKMTDLYITTDFSESQPEFITPPFEKIEDSVKFLKKLHDFTYDKLDGEYLWPMSMPAHLPAEKDIPIAHYGDSEEGKKREIYRRGLALRYGKYMQTICGVHYNVSFSDDFWDALYKRFGNKLAKGTSKQDFINDVSLNAVRNFIKYRWILVFLFGASPYKDESYRCRLMAKDKDHTISLRSSRCGYSNPAKLPITYNSFKQHLAGFKFAVDTVHSPYTDLGIEDQGEQIQLNDHILQLGNEYYFSIRLKPPKPYDDLVEALTNDGVQYFEMRIFDVNPFEYTGVNVQQMYFSHLFLLFCILNPSQLIDDEALDIATNNQQDVALFGRNPGLYLHRDGNSILMKDWAKDLFAAMKPLADAMDKSLNKPMYAPVLAEYGEALDNPKDLPAFKMVEEMHKKDLGFLEYGLQFAKKYAQQYSKRKR